MAKAQPLLNAYLGEQIPEGGGFIVSAFFEGGSSYAIYEVTAYRNVKDIFRTADGITFKTDGNRTHMLIEPASYSKKHIEPVNREAGKSIPYRFNEVTLISGKKNEKIMVAKEPMMLYSSFTILEKNADYFSFVFEPTEDVYIAIKTFIAESLNKDCGLPKTDAAEAAAVFLETIKKFTIWNG